MSRFDEKAKEWDALPLRVKNAIGIARSIEERVPLTKEMEIIDFGVGTGLLGFEIAKKVKKLYGIDTSKEMLKKIEEKNTSDLAIEPIFKDLTQERCDLRVDGIVSSMTIHHIEDIKALFKTFFDLLKLNGFIALADLVTEDGTFHSDNTGVYHFGFEKKFLTGIALEVGFKEVFFEVIQTIKKPHRNFEVFLLTAKK